MSSLKPRILHVEDDAASAALVRTILEAEGYDTLSAATSRDALRQAADESPDLLLVDLGLPDDGGLDLLDRLLERGSGIPAIVLTASGAVGDVMGAMKRGALDYLTKPVDARRLAVSVGNALRLARQQRDLLRLRAQLQQAIDRAALLETGGAEPGDASPEGLTRSVERLERSMILAALEKSGWVKARAARVLAVTERILSYKMANLGVERPQACRSAV